MRQFLIPLLLTSSFGFSAKADSAFKPAEHPIIAKTPAIEEEKLVPLEANSRLWALVQYESATGPLAFRSFLKFGDFQNLNLRGMRANDFKLQSFDFRGTDLRGADFTGADLRDVDFRGANLTNSVMLKTDARGAKFNSKTTLPFDRSEAIAQGWVYTE